MTNPQPPLRLVIAAGGTGGHVLPAVAVIDELRARGIPLDLLWIGSKSGVEGEIAEANGIDFLAVPVGKLRRYLDWQTIPDALRIPGGIALAWRHLRRFRPDVIFSTGGYVSVPVVVAGARMAPSLTHEQTAQIGLANRILARFTKRFAISYERTAEAARAIHPHVTVTGNPVRTSLADGDKARGLASFGFTPDLPVVYVTGGARGASPVNERVAGMLPDILEICQVLHQAGPASANDDARALEAAMDAWPPHLRARYVVREFIRDEIADVYAMADLVIGRAGAGTVAELAFVGKPAILIPLPGTGGDEQRKNAGILTQAGAAIALEQADATPERLRREIEDLLADHSRRHAMATDARKVGRPDAAALLADEIIELANG